MEHTPNQDFVTGVGKTHTRVNDIKLHAYPPDPNDPSMVLVKATVEEWEAITMHNGKVRELAPIRTKTIEIRQSDLKTVLQVPNSDTDENTGMTMTIEQVYGGVLALIRHHQRIWNAPAVPPPVEPEPTPVEPEPAP